MNRFIILIFISAVFAFGGQGQDNNPLIVEYITPFDVPLKDLEDAIKNQLSRNDFLTNNFTTDHVKVTNLVYKSIHNTSQIIIDPKQQSYKHRVTNDGIDLIITYNATVNHNLVDHRNYHGTTYVKILVNYTKEIDEDGSTDVESLYVKVDKAFKMEYSGNPNPNDLKKLDEINNGVVAGKQNTTILMLLETQEFTQQVILKYFLENLHAQKISPTYQRYYNYTYDSLALIFDMSTASIKPIERGIANFIKGGIKNYNNLQSYKLNSSLPSVTGEYHTLITIGFINNFVKYLVQQYQNWQKLKITKQTYPNDLFKYKLLDLEDVLSNVVSKYAKYYLNDFSIFCKVNDYNHIQIDQTDGYLSLNMIWRCQMILDGPTPSPVIMDFNASLTYMLEITINSNALNVFLKDCFIDSLNFADIQDFKILQPELISLYAKEILRKLKTYTVGSNFRIKQGSKQLFFKQNQGIYIS